MGFGVSGGGGRGVGFGVVGRRVGLLVGRIVGNDGINMSVLGARLEFMSAVRLGDDSSVALRVTLMISDGALLGMKVDGSGVSVSFLLIVGIGVASAKVGDGVVIVVRASVAMGIY